MKTLQKTLSVSDALSAACGLPDEDIAINTKCLRCIVWFAGLYRPCVIVFVPGRVVHTDCILLMVVHSDCILLTKTGHYGERL